MTYTPCWNEAITELQGRNTNEAHISLDDLQNFLNLLGASNDTDSTSQTGALLDARADGQEDEDDEDDEDYLYESVDEMDEDEEVGYYTWAQARPWDRTKWWPKITKPEKKGLELLFGGEFGRIQHQIQTRSGRHNVARGLLSSGLGSRPTRKEDITSVCLSVVPADIPAQHLTGAIT